MALSINKPPKKQKKPPPTPPQPNPWDVPPLPLTGSPTEEAVYLAIGRALTGWERMEGVLTNIFGTLAEPYGDGLVARRAYGSVLTFRGRSEMIEAAAEAFFWRRDNPTLRPAIRAFLQEAVKFAGRRNEIAHGIVGIYETGLPRFIQAAPGYVLGPPEYATNKTELKPGRHAFEYVHHAPKYAYTAAQIDVFREQFGRLERHASAILAYLAWESAACAASIASHTDSATPSAQLGFASHISSITRPPARIIVSVGLSRGMGLLTGCYIVKVIIRIIFLYTGNIARKTASSIQVGVYVGSVRLARRQCGMLRRAMRVGPPACYSARV